MSDLIVFTFNTEDEASAVLEDVVKLTQQHLLKVNDAAVAVKSIDGKVQVRQTLESAVKGGNIVSGGFWGLFVGLLFGGPLFGALLGMVLSALFGNRLDIGVDNTFIKDVGNDLKPGNSALFMLIGDMTVDKVSEVLKNHNGTLYHTSLSNEAEAAFQKALEHEPIIKALEAEHTESSL